MTVVARVAARLLSALLTQSPVSSASGPRPVPLLAVMASLMKL